LENTTKVIPDTGNNIGMILGLSIVIAAAAVVTTLLLLWCRIKNSQNQINTEIMENSLENQREGHETQQDTQ
jgi:hypothetical protein